MTTIYLGTAKPLQTPAVLLQRIASAKRNGAHIKRTFMSGSVVFHAYWPKVMQSPHNPA